MDDVLQYQGKRVVVTGCASGMGAATATLLTELGAEVLGIDIKEGDAPMAAFHQTDLSDPAAIDATVAAITVVGAVDSLCNCAGLPTTAPDRAIVAVNFLGHRHLTEALLPSMPKGSSVGFISSAGGMGWLDRIGPLLELVATESFDAGMAWCEEHPELWTGNGYAFSKEAINTYVNKRGYSAAAQVRINSIMPGPTDTPMMPSFVESMGESFFNKFPKPVGQNSTPEEQAWALVMLNSPRSSYVAATNWFTDGGFSGGIYTDSIDFAAIFAED